MLGLITAMALAFIKGAPVLYWSLEMVFLSDLGCLVMRLLKRLERVWSRRATLTIIQDAERAQSLMSENKINPQRVVIVPNGPLGPAYTAKGDFFHRKFGLQPGWKAILTAGMIAPEALSLELAEVASKWPDDWVLIMHERARRDYSDPYIKQVQAAGGGKVLLSLEPVPYDHLDAVVASGHVGVALYRRSLGPNYAQIAGASGKLAHYLRCGLPVVCLDLPGLRELIRKYQCGICVQDVGEITRAIQCIIDDYRFYSTNSIRCYEEVYEFGRHFQRVLQRIQQLEGCG